MKALRNKTTKKSHYAVKNLNHNALKIHAFLKFITFRLSRYKSEFPYIEFFSNELEIKPKVS